MKIIYLMFSSFLFVSHGYAIDCSQKPGSRPNPKQEAGTINNQIPINHIIVIVQENHSFDNYFGMLNSIEFYGNEVDGILPSYMNLNMSGEPVYMFKENYLCPENPTHSWVGQHRNWNNGRNDQFVIQNGDFVMGYYDQRDIPYYYGLAKQFAIADRYFSSAMGPTFPNRYFLMAGTAFGHIKNDFPANNTQFDQKTVFDLLSENKVSWKYYTDGSGYLSLFQPMYNRNLDKMKRLSDYFSDIQNGNLPQVVFIDATFDGQDEHPSGNIQYGQSWTATNINALIKSKYWNDSVVFLTYDENGGFYDHVPPPEACIPDQIKPKDEPSDNGIIESYKYDRYGFRVPFVAISPYAKHHYVSHNIYDHTSILKFIENKFNLPSLSYRDANADGLMDVFDFSHPIMEVNLPGFAPDPKRSCH